MKPNPLDEIKKAIATLTGRSSEMVTIRRLSIRAMGTISPNSRVHTDVVEFQGRVQLILLELELAKGHDFYGGRAELAAMFEPVRAAIEVERRRNLVEVFVQAALRPRSIRFANAAFHQPVRVHSGDDLS